MISHLLAFPFSPLRIEVVSGSPEEGIALPPQATEKQATILSDEILPQKGNPSHRETRESQNNVSGVISASSGGDVPAAGAETGTVSVYGNAP